MLPECTVVDGEIVALDADGRPSALQIPIARGVDRLLPVRCADYESCGVHGLPLEQRHAVLEGSGPAALGGADMCVPNSSRQTCRSHPIGQRARLEGFGGHVARQPFRVRRKIRQRCASTRDRNSSSVATLWAERPSTHWLHTARKPAPVRVAYTERFYAGGEGAAHGKVSGSKFLTVLSQICPRSVPAFGVPG